MTEIWKDVVGYEGRYEVSNLGRLRSLLPRKTSGDVMKPSCTGRYQIASLSTDGKIKGFGVHRLVAKAFVENPYDKPQVNHKNGDKHDNRAQNLEWATGSENMDHAIKTGLQLIKVGEEMWTSKITEDDAIWIIYFSYLGFRPLEIAELQSVPRSTVYAILNRLSWKHLDNYRTMYPRTGGKKTKV